MNLRHNSAYFFRSVIAHFLLFFFSTSYNSITASPAHVLHIKQPQTNEKIKQMKKKLHHRFWSLVGCCAPHFYRLLRHQDLKITLCSSSFEPIKNSIANHMDSCSMAFCQPVQKHQQPANSNVIRSNWTLAASRNWLFFSLRLFRIFMASMYVKQPSRTLIKAVCVCVHAQCYSLYS